MGDVPAAPTGFTRFLMKSKFGAGRDFAVLDPDNEEQLFFVDGKLGPRPKAEVQSGDGSVIYSVKGQLLGIPQNTVKTRLHRAKAQLRRDLAGGIT